MATNPLNPEGEKLPMLVHVTAPATLPAGYTFEAEINGDPSKVFNCEVPEGGVEEGQLFLARLPDDYTSTRLDAPTGKWKDGLFDCFKYGFCHPSFWCSLCCTQIAMGQAISRLQLTWLGEPGHITRTHKAFPVVVTLVVCFIIYSSALELATVPYGYGKAPAFVPALKFAGNFFFTLWAIYSLCRVRETTRARYQIPEQRCRGCEDLCCSIWCSCCVSAQILRHTGEYENYQGVCCTGTGHAPGAPITV